MGKAFGIFLLILFVLSFVIGAIILSNRNDSNSNSSNSNSNSNNNDIDNQGIGVTNIKNQTKIFSLSGEFVYNPDSVFSDSITVHVCTSRGGTVISTIIDVERGSTFMFDKYFTTGDTYFVEVIGKHKGVLFQTVNAEGVFDGSNITDVKIFYA